VSFVLVAAIAIIVFLLSIIRRDNED
jgi:hypothetical protein